jgi:hypothetical protein
MKAQAKLKRILTGVGSTGFISNLYKTYQITYAQNPVSRYILVEIQITTGRLEALEDNRVVTGTRSIIHDNWVEFDRTWSITEVLEASMQPEGY